MINSVRIIPFTEYGFLARFEDCTDIARIGLHTASLAKTIINQGYWLDVTPGMDSLCARFDPIKVTYKEAQRSFAEIVSSNIPKFLPEPSTVIEVPVCYGGEYGPDLNLLSDNTGMSVTALIDLHTHNSVRVISMGFAPGFAYLGPIAEELNLPRRRSPRISVKAGSVGVADQFTGIYSMPSPGGWQIIGRTPIKLITMDSGAPFLLQPNVEVKFRAIDTEEFLALESYKTSEQE